MIKDVSDTGGKKIGAAAHKKLARKAPAHVVSERVEMVAELLARGCNHRTIRLTLEKKPHCLSYRQIGEYVTRAQQWLLREASGMSKAQALAESINYWRQVIANSKNETHDKNDARKQLDLIFGLHAPRALAIREIPLPNTGADEIQRQENPSMERALELVYGPTELQRVIDIETKQLPTPEPNKKKKLALT